MPVGVRAPEGSAPCSVCFCGSQAIITALGVDRRNRVLAGLYMGRSDTQLVVRQASLHVWKIVVSNTPRTLREILPTLFGLLLGFLASTCADKRTVSLLGLAALQPQGPVRARGAESAEHRLCSGTI